MDRGEAVEPRVADEGHVEPFARMADRPRRRRGDGEQGPADENDGERAQVGRTEAGPGGEARDERERDARREDGGAAVQALDERRAATGADVVAAAEEGEAGAEADDRAADEAECRNGGRQRDRVPERDQGEPDERAGARAPSIGGAPARNLHPHVQDELGRREQPDRREPDAVGVAQAGRDRAESGDVPADGDSDGEAPHERTRPDPALTRHRASLRYGCAASREDRLRRPELPSPPHGDGRRGAVGAHAVREVRRDGRRSRRADPPAAGVEPRRRGGGARGRDRQAGATGVARARSRRRRRLRVCKRRQRPRPPVRRRPVVPRQELRDVLPGRPGRAGAGFGARRRRAACASCSA